MNKPSIQPRPVTTALPVKKSEWFKRYSVITHTPRIKS